MEFQHEQTPEINIVNDSKYDIPENIGEIVFYILKNHYHQLYVDLSIAFVNNEEIQNLNASYLGYAKPTDVLSFSAKEVDPETGRLYLGDIVISFPFVSEQSKTMENSIHGELSLMIIHGLLHLLDFDHDTKENKTEMWLAQEQALNALGIYLTNLPE
jgi:probable rRNA maturation factor